MKTIVTGDTQVAPVSHSGMVDHGVKTAVLVLGILMTNDEFLCYWSVFATYLLIKVKMSVNHPENPA